MEFKYAALYTHTGPQVCGDFLEVIQAVSVLMSWSVRGDDMKRPYCHAPLVECSNSPKGKIEGNYWSSWSDSSLSLSVSHIPVTTLLPWSPSSSLADWLHRSNVTSTPTPPPHPHFLFHRLMGFPELCSPLSLPYFICWHGAGKGGGWNKRRP